MNDTNFTSLSEEDIALKVKAYNDILELKDADFRINTSKAFKNNLGIITTFNLSDGEHEASPKFYPSDSFFEMDDTKAIEVLMEMYEKKSLDFDINPYIDSEFITDHILPKLLSSSNASSLEENDIPYIPFLDMVVCFYVPIENFEEGFACIQVSSSVLALTGLSLDELFERAKANAAKTILVRNIYDVLAEKLSPEEKEMLSLFETPLPMLVASNVTDIHGAAPAFLCEESLKIGEKRFGDKFYILPSSINEALYVGITDSGEEYMLDMVSSINQTEVREDEVLTTNVYVYENGKVRALF